MNNQDNSSNENNSVENNNTNTNNNSVESNNANTNNTTQNPDEVQNIISNQKIYLEVLKKEYDLELAKKQSLETRAGFIFAFIATISTFLFDKVKLNFLLYTVTTVQSLIINLKVIAGLGIYLTLGFIIYKTIKIITAGNHNAFNIDLITDERFSERHKDELMIIIQTYKDIIAQHRSRNEERAKFLTYTLYAILILLILIAIYFSIYLKEI